MASVLSVILALELAICLLNTLGSQALGDILWALIVRLPTEKSRLLADQKRLQHEFVQVRREMNATSSQDDFAKWARLRRQQDKLVDELEKTKRTLDAARSRFGMLVAGLLTLFGWVPHLVLPMWYASRPMFWLPYGLFPSWIEWLLCFPRAPLGSVSAGCWQMACGLGIKLAMDAVAALLAMIWRPSLEAKAKMTGSGATVGSDKAQKMPDMKRDMKG